MEGKLRHYHDLVLVADDYDKTAREIIKHFGPSLRSKYSTDNSNLQDEIDIEISLSNQLKYILWAVGGELEGKAILDIGCGSGFSTEDRLEEPWLCRLIHEMGSYAIGVDIYNNSGEEFEYHQVNFIQDPSLSFIRSVDLVDVTNAYEILNKHNEFTLHSLLPDMKRVTKPGGKIIFS